MSTSVITKARRKMLAEITSGKITTIPAITHIAFGSGGVDENGEPKQASETQTALFTEVQRYPIDSVTYPVDTTARYSVEIPEADLVSVKISEAGLIDTDGTLCAIKTMYIKQKDENVKFTFEFDDEF